MPHMATTKTVIIINFLNDKFNEFDNTITKYLQYLLMANKERNCGLQIENLKKIQGLKGFPQNGTSYFFKNCKGSIEIIAQQGLRFHIKHFVKLITQNINI